MVILSSSTEKEPFTLPSREPQGCTPSYPSEAYSSFTACLVQKQKKMRTFIGEHLPKTELCSVSASIYQGFDTLHPRVTVRVASIADLGLNNLDSDENTEARDSSFLLQGKVEKGQAPEWGKGGEATSIGDRIGSEEACSEQKTKEKVRRLKLGYAWVKRLLSGACAGAVSGTAVAPLETIRTHLMVGSGGQTVGDVFHHIMHTEGWQGLFRGNGVNVIRVAPSKAIELFMYDTVKKALDRTPWFPSRIPIPPSSIAGAAAGVCSTLFTYPLELLKTRLTIQQGVYKNLTDACVRICREEGPSELYRGLTPSLIGVVPYAAANYLAYDFLRKLYKKLWKRDRVGNLPTLLIGSAAAAFASASTFPLELARKQMQVGALTERVAYDNVFHALGSLLEQHGPVGLYRGLGASCIKLIPAAGISFMCYEACKRVLLEEEGQ